MKRCIGLCLCIIMIAALAACGKSTDPAPSDTPAVSTADETLTPTKPLDPADSTDEPVREILSAISEITKHDSFSINIEETYTVPDYMEAFLTMKKKINHDPADNSFSIYWELSEKYDDNDVQRQYQYNYLKEDGGVVVDAHFDN